MFFHERKMGWRYLRGAQRGGFLSVMGWITVVGLLVGVMAMVVALAFASGFESVLRDKIIGVNAHLIVLRYDGGIPSWWRVRERIEALDGVDRTLPFTYNQGMLRSEEGVAGTIVRGILVEEFEAISGMGIRFPCGGISPAFHGEEEAVGAEAPQGRPVWLGKVLAEELHVTCGDPITLIALSDEGRDMAEAKLASYRVQGVFDVGMYEYDASLAFLPLAEAQRFFGLGEAVTGIEVRLQDVRQTDRLESEIVQALGYPFWVKNWRGINPNFFAALKLQKVVMFLVLILIVLVGGFNIISTLIMSVIEKRREIAILKAMGCTQGSIGRIFFMVGVVVGSIGIGLGLSAGYLLCLGLGAFPFIRLDPDVYYLSHLPVEVRAGEFLLVAVAALVLTLAATLYPARRAGKLDPAEVLRYE